MVWKSSKKALLASAARSRFLFWLQLLLFFVFNFQLLGGLVAGCSIIGRKLSWD
jgi:hypothetical protein